MDINGERLPFDELDSGIHGKPCDMRLSKGSRKSKDTTIIRIPSIRSDRNRKCHKTYTDAD
ncbi:MAG: hypothetical protein CMJ77_04225 [Planctomycetaceae bacterium]|nr:hypothetical protein [Planctomycetaceae bacterium]